MAAFNSDVLYTESVSAVTATPSVSLGAYRVENGKSYRYVYNGSTETALVGHGVIATANSAYTVAVNAAIGDFCYGVVTNVQLTTATYGWVQVKGPALITMGPAAGEFLMNALVNDGIQLGTSGFFSGLATAGTGSSQSAKSRCCGVATTAMAADASGLVWLTNQLGA